MNTTYRSKERNEKGICKRLAEVKENKNGFTYVNIYEFPMTGAEQYTANFKQANRFENKEAALKFAKDFANG